MVLSLPPLSPFYILFLKHMYIQKYKERACSPCNGNHFSIYIIYVCMYVCNKYNIDIYYIPPPLTVHFPMTRSVRYQPILHTLYYTLHTEHAYCLSYCFLNIVAITTVIEMVEMVEILKGRLGKHSVERVRYVIGRAKRAPHWGVQSRLRVIYICLYVSMSRMSN